MSGLVELLQAHPNCRVTIAKPRKVSREGDVKFVRGKRFVRRQRYSEQERAYLVHRGRPMFEWVREDL